MCCNRQLKKSIHVSSPFTEEKAKKEKKKEKEKAKAKEKEKIDFSKFLGLNVF